MTKQRQAKVLKKQQEKERAKAQAEANKDKPNNANRPRPQKSKAKASHPDQIKSSKKGRRTARTHNDNSVITDNFQHHLMKFHTHVQTHFYTPNDKN